jgi:O-antigen/teichoic acid export membrane protein
MVVEQGKAKTAEQNELELAGAKGSFVRALGQTFFGRAVFSAALLVIGILTARLLGPEGRGHYALFFTIVGIGANLGGFGLTQSNTYFLNRENWPISVLFGNTIFAVFLVGLLLGVIISISEHYSFMGWVGTVPGWLLSLALIISVLETHVGGLAYGSHLYSFQARSMIVQALFLLVATLLIVPFGENWLLALELRVAASLLFMAWYVRLFTSKVSLDNVAINLIAFCAQFRFGIKNWLQNLVGILNYRGYLLILGAISGAESVGFFSIGLLFAEAIRFFPESLGAVLLPRLVSMLPGDGPEQLTARACRLIVVCMATFGLGLIAISDWLVIAVFGNEFSSSVPATRILIAGAVLGTVYQILTRYFTSEHAQWYSITAGVGGLLVALISSMILVPKFHVLGAGAAYVLCSLTTCIVALWGFGKKSEKSPFVAILPCKQDWLILIRLILKK